MNIAIKEMQINEEIRDRELRVIDADGEAIGIMSAAEALKIAEEKNLDLVKIAPQAKPPVCKIMDYGKYRFEQTKRERKQGRISVLSKLKKFAFLLISTSMTLKPRSITQSASLKAETRSRFQSASAAVKWLTRKTVL